MKKIAVVFLVQAFLMMTFAALPVMAEPTGGQKVPFTMEWKNTGPTTLLERRDVDGGISHRIMIQNWAVQLFIDGATTPIEGTAVGMRQTLFRYGKPDQALDQIVNDHYVVSFPTSGGGFEGNAHIVLTDYISPTSYNVKLRALFQGTGMFEGQTLNAWQIGAGANKAWEGYILKK